MSLDGEPGTDDVDWNVKAPLVWQHTAKSRELQRIGHARRHARLAPDAFAPTGGAGLGELAADLPPSAPEAQRLERSSPTGGAATAAQLQQKQAMRRTQDAAANWLNHSQSEPGFWPGCAGRGRGAAWRGNGPEVRGTFTSSTREILARQAMLGTVAPPSPTSGGPRSPDGASAVGMSATEWISRGFGFRDKGLGIGSRFEVPSGGHAGPGLYQQEKTVGNVALWSPKASQPARQPDSRHCSPPVHKIGVRHQVGSWLVSDAGDGPGPGTYSSPAGFSEELRRKTARRPRAEAPAKDDESMPQPLPSLQAELGALAG